MKIKTVVEFIILEEKSRYELNIIPPTTWSWGNSIIELLKNSISEDIYIEIFTNFYVKRSEFIEYIFEKKYSKLILTFLKIDDNKKIYSITNSENHDFIPIHKDESKCLMLVNYIFFLQDLEKKFNDKYSNLVYIENTNDVFCTNLDKYIVNIINEMKSVDGIWYKSIIDYIVKILSLKHILRVNNVVFEEIDNLYIDNYITFLCCDFELYNFNTLLIFNIHIDKKLNNNLQKLTFRTCYIDINMLDNTKNTLKYIDISNSQIMNLENLKNFKHLENIKLINNDITDIKIIIDILKNLPNLKSIDITNNKFEWNELISLIKHFKDINIYTTLGDINTLEYPDNLESTPKEIILSEYDTNYTKFFPVRDTDMKYRFTDVSIYSSTPVTHSLYIANLIKCFYYDDEIRQLYTLDATACIGCNTWSIAQLVKNVTTVEIYKIQCEILLHNMKIVNVNNVNCVNDNILTYLKNEDYKTNVIFFDPPWGGIDYKTKNYDITLSDEKGYIFTLEEIVYKMMNICEVLILKLPSQYNMDFCYDKYKVFKTIYIYPLDERINNPKSLYKICIISHIGVLRNHEIDKYKYLKRANYKNIKYVEKNYL